MQIVSQEDWGIIDYQQAWDRQTALHQSLVKAKRENIQLPQYGHFILCEHPPVYTLGKSGKEDHLLLDEIERAAKGLSFYKINRGGDITHHGPGQIVGYPILDLEYWYRDVHRYVREIEEVIIRTLDSFNIEGFRVDDYTGVWTRSRESELRKVCAIGVHLSRWVSMHGFALNVNNDLSLFNHIIPCGINDDDKSVTSMEQLSGEKIDLQLVKDKLNANFADVFECNLITKQNAEN